MYWTYNGHGRVDIDGADAPRVGRHLRVQLLPGDKSMHVIINISIKEC